MPGRVTAADVALAAGVGKTTVSYVLNSTPNQKIPEATRQRVLEAAASLKYIPMSAARALRRGRGDVVLAVLPDWPLARVVASILEHLSDELEQHGLSLIIRRARHSTSVATLCRELTPAAVIAFGDLDESEQEAMRASGIFVAAAFRGSSATSADAVRLPQEAIGLMQVEHLAGRGHRNVGYAAPVDDHLGVGLLRARGARQACDALGLSRLVELSMEPTLESAVHAAGQFAAAEVTAVAVFNDEIAVALLAGMRELDLSAPDDLALIGVDNEPMSQFSWPPLSTVAVDTRKMADVVARAVIGGMAGDVPGDLDPKDALSLLARGTS